MSASNAYAEANTRQTKLLELIADEIGFDSDSPLPADAKDADWGHVGTVQAANEKLLEALAILGNEHARNATDF